MTYKNTNEFYQISYVIDSDFYESIKSVSTHFKSFLFLERLESAFFGFDAAPIPWLYYFDGIYDPLPDDLQEKVRQGKKYAFYTCPPGRHWQNYLDQVSAGTTKLRNIFPVNIMPAALADETPEIANLLDGRDGGPSLRHRRFGDKIVFCVPALQRTRVYNTFDACDRLVEELIMERDLNVFIFPNSHFLSHCGEIPKTIVPLEGLLNGDITP